MDTFGSCKQSGVLSIADLLFSYELQATNDDSIPDVELAADVVVADDDICVLCHSGDNAEKMLLCDLCVRVVRTLFLLLSPPLPPCLPLT